MIKRSDVHAYNINWLTSTDNVYAATLKQKRYHIIYRDIERVYKETKLHALVYLIIQKILLLCIQRMSHLLLIR